jgi:hypothetical protein
MAMNLLLRWLEERWGRTSGRECALPGYPPTPGKSVQSIRTVVVKSGLRGLHEVTTCGGVSMRGGFLRRVLSSGGGLGGWLVGTVWGSE